MIILISILEGLMYLGYVGNFICSQTGIAVLLLGTVWGTIIYLGSKDYLDQLNKNQFFTTIILLLFCIEFFNIYIGFILFLLIVFGYRTTNTQYEKTSFWKHSFWKYKYLALIITIIFLAVLLVGHMPHLFGLYTYTII
jgi:hypothetical protein